MKTMLNNRNTPILAISFLFLSACGGGGPGGTASGAGGGPFPGSVTGTGPSSGPVPGPVTNNGVDNLIQTAIGDDEFEPDDAERDCVNAIDNATTTQIQDCINNN